MKLYHLSKNPNLSVLTPRVPSNYYTKHGFQNAKTGRVCFAPTIQDCVNAVPDAEPGALFYVYIATGVDNKFIYKPNRSEVADIKYTNEIWYLKPVNVKKIATVIIGDTTLWEQFDNRDYFLQRQKRNFKKFNTVPTKEEREKYLSTQPAYQYGLKEEAYFNKQKRNSILKSVLASSAGTALLMLIGHKLINLKK